MYIKVVLGILQKNQSDAGHLSKFPSEEPKLYGKFFSNLSVFVLYIDFQSYNILCNVLFEYSYHYHQ